MLLHTATCLRVPRSGLQVPAPVKRLPSKMLWMLLSSLTHENCWICPVLHLLQLTSLLSPAGLWKQQEETLQTNSPLSLFQLLNKSVNISKLFSFFLCVCFYSFLCCCCVLIAFLFAWMFFKLLATASLKASSVSAALGTRWQCRFLSKILKVSIPHGSLLQCQHYR